MNCLTDTQREEALEALKMGLEGKIHDSEIVDDYDQASDYPELSPGIILEFKTHANQRKFIAAANELLMKTEGDHNKNGEIKPEYKAFATRLPNKTQDSDKSYFKVYPVHFTDAALKVLCLPDSIKELRNSLVDQKNAEAADSTVSIFNPRSRN